MAEIAANGPALTVRERPADSSHRRVRHGRRRKPARRPLPRQIGLQELGERIAAAPSRAHMTRPRPKADYLEHTWRFYNALWRLAHAKHSAHFDAAWGQLKAVCGYADDAQVQHSVERYAAILEEIGAARVYGVRDAYGAWQRLDVELLTAPELSSAAAGPCSSTGRAADS